MLPIIIAYQRRDSQPRPEFSIRAIKNFFCQMLFCQRAFFFSFSFSANINMLACQSCHFYRKVPDPGRRVDLKGFLCLWLNFSSKLESQ